MTLNPSFSRFFTPAAKSFFFLINQLGVIVYTIFNHTPMPLPIEIYIFEWGVSIAELNPPEHQE
jgi:hypothetical protein